MYVFLTSVYILKMTMMSLYNIPLFPSSKPLILHTYIITIGFVRRGCIQNNTWGPVEDVKNCLSTEISALFDSSRRLRSYYYGDSVFDFFDIREFPLLDLNTASRELYSLTNSSRPLAPRDLISINDILDTIIR